MAGEFMKGAIGRARDLEGKYGSINDRITGTITRPADNNAYSAGDLIGNSLTAGLVVPITFSQATQIVGGSGKLTGCRCTVTPGSGNLVITNFAFDLIIFRPQVNIPFADGAWPADNAALNISAAAMKEVVGVFSFLANAWRNQAGSAAAGGTSGLQIVQLNDARKSGPFNLSGLSSQNLIGCLQAQGAWTPTGIANTFDFVIDVDGN